MNYGNAPTGVSRTMASSSGETGRGSLNGSAFTAAPGLGRLGVPGMQVGDQARESVADDLRGFLGRHAMQGSFADFSEGCREPGPVRVHDQQPPGVRIP